MQNIALVHTRAQRGIEAPAVRVEVHLANGLPSLSIVGLPETEVRESKDRVRSAIVNAGFDFPVRRITINLAPADLPKQGGRFDLPIAIGILAASAQIDSSQLEHYEFLGELALTGDLRPVPGLLPAAIQSQRRQRSLVLPCEQCNEVTVFKQRQVYRARHLLEVTGHLCSQQLLDDCPETLAPENTVHVPDMADVLGQESAKHAMVIAAAGGHNLLLIGPPGTGKSMLAQRLPGILPPMQEQQALETASVYSISQQGFDSQRWQQRPFRAPHHTVSAVALVGGGSNPRPGEITLAHNGVLFLDELPEFQRRVLEVLREPMETGCIHISRAARQVSYPARFQLIAAMNPCPCGYHGDPSGTCNCSADQIQRYRQRLSGPLLDRIDMQLQVPRVPLSLLNKEQRNTECSASMRQRVLAAYAIQEQRAGKANARLEVSELNRYCVLDADCHDLMQLAEQRLGLSHRAYHRILKISRTIADLDNSAAIRPEHLQEAIGYRQLDRNGNYRDNKASTVS
jgi:magnesium chelatase family protein